jgi:hypothetical protein
MLKDLKFPIKGNVQKQKVNIDTEISCNLIDILFKHVLASIEHDRSTVKLNMFQRGMIGGVLGKTRDGTKEYVVGMRNDDIKALLNDIETELSKRK